MAVIVVTRLRLVDHAVLDEFFADAVALLEQANAAPGVINADVLAEASNTWWTCTSWQDRAAMATYVDTDPHQSTMPKLAQWCDEATFVDWDHDSGELPDWPSAYERLVADGRSATLPHASPDNETRAFPSPVIDAT